MSANYCAAAQAALSGQLIGRRRGAWPILAGVSLEGRAPPAWGAHSPTYFEQLEKDTNRALHRVVDDDQRLHLRQRLNRLLNVLFGSHPTWHYFQGYHDLVGIILLVFDLERGNASDEDIDTEVYFLAEQLSMTHWSGHLLTGDLNESRSMLMLLAPLLSVVDEPLAKFLAKAAPEPIFALPWLLTWFSYNIEGLAQASLCFDLFICTHPLAPLYLAAVMILTQRDVILQLESDYAAVHGALSRLPTHVVPQLPSLISRTVTLLARHPPSVVFPSFATFPLGSPVHRFPFPHHAPVVFPRPSLALRLQLAYRGAPQWSVIAISSILVLMLAYAALRVESRAYGNVLLLRRLWT